MSAPTGAGKSPIAFGVAQLLASDGLKTTVLTHQKELQRQYMRLEFEEDRPQPRSATGRANHMCILDNHRHKTAAEAPCTTGFKCHLRKPLVPGDPSTALCPYYQQLLMAHDAKIRVLNYPMFIEGTRNGYFRGNGILICDEGHRVDKAILEAVSTTITLKDQQLLRDLGIKMPKVQHPSLKHSPHIFDWQDESRDAVNREIARIEARRFEVPDQMKKLSYKLDTVGLLQNSAAVVNYQETGSLQFRPVLSEEWAHRLMLRHAKKTVLMSATLVGGDDYWAGRMGIHPDDAEYIEIPSTFPVDNRRVFFWPVVQMNERLWSRDDEMMRLVQAIDTIIAGYLPHKGLIHTANKRLAYYIRDRSKFNKIMFVGGVSDGTIDYFKEASVGVLVSYSATEGVDLPDDLCRYTIFAKVPWLPKNDPVIQVQMEEIPGFYDYEAAAAVVQGVGRGNRHENDWCVNFILDASWRMLFAKTKHLLPSWFTEAHVQVDRPPMPVVRSA